MLPVVHRDELRDMLRGLKVARLLDGFRGSAPRDLEALVDCCMRFCDFVVASDGRFAAIDLNPVLVRPRARAYEIADALIEQRGIVG